MGVASLLCAIPHQAGSLLQKENTLTYVVDDQAEKPEKLCRRPRPC